MANDKNSNKPSLTFAHILSPAVDAAARTIRDWRRSRNLRFRELYLTPLSTFFDPVHRSVEAHERDVCFKGVVSIALVDRPKKGRVIMAFLEGASPADAGVCAFLTQRGIPVMQGGLDDAVRVQEFLSNVIGLQVDGGLGAGMRPVTSQHERWMLTEIAEILGTRISPQWQTTIHRRTESEAKMLKASFDEYSNAQKRKFKVFHETSLGELVRPTDGESANSTVVQSLRKLRAFRCDAVVVTPGPLGRPLLVVEDDDRTHDDPKKADKDKWRDQLLTDAGIAVFRISHRNPDLAEARPSADKRAFSRFLHFVVGQLAEALYEEFVVYAPAREARFQQFLGALSDTIAHVERKRGRSLERAERLLLYEELHRRDSEANFVQHIDEVLEQKLYVDQHQLQFGLHDLEKRTKGRLRSLNEESFYDESNGSVWGQVELEWAEDGSRERLVTPRFFCRLKLPSTLDQSFFPFAEIRDAGVKHLLLNEALRMASRR